ncbi:MAG: AAA family ATPase [Lewinellaceae bacterium]|nr:AAA family ATPase [Lewinellaceae bacterium]
MKPLTIAITGPESSGKTTLAALLATTLGAPWVPEFARYYTAYLGRPYVQADLQAIGSGQKSLGGVVCAKGRPYLPAQCPGFRLAIRSVARKPEQSMGIV